MLTLAQNRSFKDYITKRFDNQFWSIAEQYLAEEFDTSALTFYRLHHPGQPEIEDVTVEHIWAEDLPGMEIQFDVMLTYCDFPSEHWTRIRTNNVIERLNREIRRRIRVVGCFPDGNSALMLVCARLRHVAGTQWGNKKYMNMKHIDGDGDINQMVGIME